MGFFGFGKKKEKEQQSAQAEETRLEAQADETSGAENAQTAAGDAEQAAQDEKKQGLFSRLWQGLSKTRGNVAGRVDELIEATETIDEDFYEDLVDILIMSDMGVRTSDKVIQELKTRVARERITDAKKARAVGYAENSSSASNSNAPICCSYLLLSIALLPPDFPCAAFSDCSAVKLDVHASARPQKPNHDVTIPSPRTRRTSRLPRSTAGGP